MAKTTLPTLDFIHKVLAYDPDTGLFLWRERTADTVSGPNPKRTAAAWNARWAGKRAFTYQMPNGYLAGRADTHKLLAHRTAFAMTWGYWPITVDHINRDRADNRASNLREATYSQQNFNRPPVTKASPYRGVTQLGSRWLASAKKDGKSVNLGVYETQEEAARVRDAFVFRIDPQFAILNFPIG